MASVTTVVEKVKSFCIYHNPDCSKSRKLLAHLTDNDDDTPSYLPLTLPLHQVLYRQTGLQYDTLSQLLVALKRFYNDDNAAAATTCSDVIVKRMIRKEVQIDEMKTTTSANDDDEDDNDNASDSNSNSNSNSSNVESVILQALVDDPESLQRPVLVGLDVIGIPVVAVIGRPDSLGGDVERFLMTYATPASTSNQQQSK